jgi:hypothetical protein
MRLLLMDILRRGKLPYVYACVFCFAAANTSSFAYSSFGMAMGMGVMLGVVFESRELHYLPISRKDIWRARWILSLVPVVLSAVIGILAFAIVLAISQVTPLGARTDRSWLLPSTVFQLVYIGSLLAASIPALYLTRRIALPARRLLVNVVLVLSAMALGLQVEQQLPRQWQEMTGGIVVILGIGLCLTAIGFFHSPKILPREFVTKPLKASSHATKPDLKAREMWAGRTGLNFLVWRQVLAFLITGVVCGIMSHLPVLFLVWQPADRAALIERGGTLFESPDLILAVSYFLVPLLLSAMWTAFAPDWLRVRELRVLPITTRTVAAMFTLLPLLTWLTFWLFLLAGYWLLTGHLPSTFRLDLLAGIAGLTCLLNSASMQARVKAPGGFLLSHLLSCTGFILLYLYLQPLSPAVTSLVPEIGLIGVGVSFLLNVRALQRNSSVYVSLIRVHTAFPQRFIAQ